MFLREKDKTYSSSPTTHTSTKKSNKKHPLVPPLHGLLKSFSVSHLTSIAEPSASEKRPSPLSNLRTLKKIHLPFSSSSPKLAKASSPTSLTSPLARVKPLPSFLSPLLSAASTSTSTSATSPTPSLLFPVDPPSQKNTACLRVHVLYMTVPSSWPVTLNDLYLTLTSTLPTHQDGPSSVSCFTFQYTQDGFWTSDAASWFPILDATRPIQVTCQLHSKKDPSFTLRSTIPFPLYTHLSTFTFSCPSSMSTSSLSLSSKNKTTSWTLPLHVYFQVTFHPTPSSSSSDSSDSSSSTSTTSMLSIQDFELTQYVGRGRFGKVFQVKFKHNQKYYAIKFLKKELALHTKRDQLHLHSEKTILLMIRHPFIVPLKFAFQSEGYLCLVMPFMHGGELFKHLSDAGRFHEPRVRFYTAELASALHCLHSHDIIYRDLKPENILLDAQGHIALCDFGLCKLNMSDTTRTHTFCGTPEYLACEVISGVGYTKKVDWWTLGILMYEMLTGRPPFYDPHLPTMYHKILTAPLLFPSFVGEEAAKVIQGLLCRQPSRRDGYEALKSQAFFKSLSWDQVETKQLPPPFLPTLTHVTDTSHFDPTFTRVPPSLSPTALTFSSHKEETQSSVFDTFDFIPPHSANEEGADPFGSNLTKEGRGPLK